MRNFGKFISKHLFIYLSVIILIVGFDLLLFFLTFNGTVNSISENNPVQTLEKKYLIILLSKMENIY